METVSQRLAGLNGEIQVLSEKELDSLCNVGAYVNNPLETILSHIDECQDYDSVDEQVKNAREELTRTYDNGNIDGKRLTEGLDAVTQKGDYVRARIEKEAIQENERGINLDTATPEEIVSHMENLRTVIADARFIDFHTKCEMMENINSFISASELKEKPSESTSKFLKKMQERRQEQERLLNEVAEARNKDALKDNHGVQEKKQDPVNGADATGDKKNDPENLIQV